MGTGGGSGPVGTRGKRNPTRGFGIEQDKKKSELLRGTGRRLDRTGRTESKVRGRAA